MTRLEDTAALFDIIVARRQVRAFVFGPDGLELTLRTLADDHPQNGQRVALAWR